MIPANSLSPSHDPHVTAWLKEYLKPGDVFYDVGANIGLFSQQAAKLGARVYAFEALTSAASAIPHDSNITVMTAAVWSKSGYLDLVFAGDSQHCEVSDDPDIEYPYYFSRPDITVASISLEEITPFWPKPHILKSDTQGCEVHILRGAGDALSECRTMILERNGECLNRHGTTIEELDELIDKLGFYIEGHIKEDVICQRKS